MSISKGVVIGEIAAARILHPKLIAYVGNAVQPAIKSGYFDRRDQGARKLTEGNFDGHQRSACGTERWRGGGLTRGATLPRTANFPVLSLLPRHHLVQH
jgi:hypothetical protein